MTAPTINSFSATVLAVTALLLPLPACTMQTDTPSRHQTLDVFDPHRTTFTCVHEAAVVPPIDPQADAWFEQAKLKESLEIPIAQRDYTGAALLYKQAAERKHWKAQLNLAALYLEGLGVQHDTETAIKLVEQAMQWGVPAAYDRMGTYVQNGLVYDRKPGTRAYAFWQKAADMGNAAAQTFLAEKMMMARELEEAPDRWANIPRGTKMLECAFAQGNAEAAYVLGGYTGYNATTTEEKKKALILLHEGVKLGSKKCADKLSVEFDGIRLSDGKNLAGHIDAERSERYSEIGDYMTFHPDIKLPNLDAVLPLPPAKLPTWDGNIDKLIEQAQGVRPTPQKPVLPGHSMNGRYNIPKGHVLAMGNLLPHTLRGYIHYQQNPAEFGIARAPMSGYWQAKAHAFKNQIEISPEYLKQQTEVVSMPPAYFQEGEMMEARAFYGDAELHQLIDWELKGLPVAVNAPTDWLAKAGIIRNIDPATIPPLQAGVTLCKGDQACPQSGVWWPKVPADEKLAVLINPWWRQRYVVQGAAFPNPKDWHVDVAAEKVEWRLIEFANTSSNDEAPVFVKMDNAPDDSGNSVDGSDGNPSA